MDAPSAPPPSQQPGLPGKQALVRDPLRAPLTGVVRDERGRPVGGARVVAGRPPVVVLTDELGRFTLTGVPRAATRLRIEHPGYAPAETAIGEEALEVRLSPGGGVSGQVSERRLGALPQGVRLTVEAGGEHRLVPLGSDGRFSVTGLPAGPARLRAQAPGYVTQTWTLDLPPGDEPGDVTLRDERLELERGGDLSGEVRQGGAAGAGAQIVVVDEVGDEVARLRADQRGAFRCGPLRPGKHTVRASAPGVEASERAVVSAGDEARVVLDLRAD